MSELSVNVTRLLSRLGEGEQQALDKLFPAVYGELRRIAHVQRYGESSETLNTTALVHEAYFKLVDHNEVDWRDRTHFFAVAARAMRQVLVDHARKRSAKKRGGKTPNLSLEDAPPAKGTDHYDDTLLVLEEALQKLEEMDERQGKVVECRFFAGLTVEETAQALDVSPSTVKRDWRTAKAWLYREMDQ